MTKAPFQPHVYAEVNVDGFPARLGSPRLIAGCLTVMMNLQLWCIRHMDEC